MANPTWIEVWRNGRGRTTRVCTVEDTVEGCAVDVFRADTCIHSAVYPTRDEAIRVARNLRRSLNAVLARRDVSDTMLGCARARAARSAA